jgi:hypothetical protein
LEDAAVKDRKEGLGARKNARVELKRPAFIIPAPDAPLIECLVVDVSEGGVCVDVGALVIPEIFGLAFNSSGTIRRVCLSIWRNGSLIGARFVTAQELRDRAKPVIPTDPKRQAIVAPPS